MQTLWVVGDSTLSAFNDKYFYPRYGYGTMLDQYLDGGIRVVNLALSGRSSKSYLEEPEYQTLLKGMGDGDFLLMGFGHNDEKAEAGRFTDGQGDYRSPGSFANSLYENYIRPAVKVGCQPILATAIVRRTATGEWDPQDLHITEDVGEFKGGDYAQIVRKLSLDLEEKEQIKVPVVDMTTMTKNLYEELGPEQTIYLHAWPSNNVLSVDNTHTNIWGARVNAYMVMRTVQNLRIAGLSEHVTGLEKDAPYPAKEIYLVSNADYVPTVFSTDLPDSRLWKDYVDAKGNHFKGTVFGDLFLKPEEIEDHFVLEPVENGSMHIVAKNSHGKISLVTEGIAMYYRAVSAKKNFRLSATIRIKDYFSNDQVSFGLMVRDDVYIDKVTPDILGDYVAAAPLYLTKKAEAVNCFARKNGVLVYGGTVTREYRPGDVVKVRLQSTSDGYMAQFGDEKEITGGFDFKLTAIDPEHVYVGMFVARYADVVFEDIDFEEF
ncbi:MAG: carbohydrate esterase family 12 protein [Lachnospiraceae bacterium]|nr:carbohydrate esterase family 12 protein [Lachnospiraceae bacterium]